MTQWGILYAGGEYETFDNEAEARTALADDPEFAAMSGARLVMRGRDGQWREPTSN